jgi:hypothetical protein
VPKALDPFVTPLDRPIAEILADSRRKWTPRPSANEDKISELCELVRFELPSEYIDLLRYCDGGFGDLDAPPLLFGLDSIAEALDFNASEFRKTTFPDFWFFGGNRGLEMIAFDLREGPPWRIVMIDPIAGPGSAEVIAESMADFIPKIGRAVSGPSCK